MNKETIQQIAALLLFIFGFGVGVLTVVEVASLIGAIF